MAVRTTEACPARAHVATGHVLTGAPVHAGVRLALVVVDVAVGPTPARVTQAFIPIDQVLAVPVDAGVADALVDLREAGGVVVALGTQAGEPVYAVNAGAAIVAGVESALVDVDVAHRSCVTRLAGTLVTVDFVNALPVVARVVLAVVQVGFAIEARGAFGAYAEVGVLPVLAGAPVLTGLTLAFVDVGLAQAAGVARPAVAGERGQTVLTGPVVTGVRVALVYVRFAVKTSVAFCAFACVLVGSVCTFGPILARCAGTLIDVHLAQAPRESYGAFAAEGVNPVNALPIVQAGHVGALVHINLAEHAIVSWHTDTAEASDLVQARGVVLAGVGYALIDVQFTAGPSVALHALALERALSVQALASVFTGVCTQGALIDVLAAGGAHVPRRTGADGLAIDGVGVAVGALLAGVANAGVVQVTQQTCASGWALAEEGRHAVVAGGPSVAGGARAVVDVFAAVVAGPAVYADAVVPAVLVVARGTVLARVGHQLALVHVVRAVLACPNRCALAVVRVHSVNTGGAIFAAVPGTIVNVVFTVLTIETWQTGALVGRVPLLHAGAPVLAGRGVAGHIQRLAVFAGILRRAHTVVGPHLIDARAPVLARRGAHGALIHILLAGLPRECRRAPADVV